MKQVPLSAKIRPERGTTQIRNLRHQGWVPAELYGKKEENKSLSVSLKEITRLLQAAGGENLFFNLAIDGGTEQLAILKEVQYDRLSHAILHADFQKVRIDEKIKVKVPLRVRNAEACPGIKEGGTLQLLKRAIEVFSLPDRIPESVEADIAEFQINQSLHVADLKIPEGVQVLDSPKDVVLNIAAPMAEEVVAAPTAAVPAEGEAAAPAEGAAAGAAGEPEVLTAKKGEAAGEPAKGKEAGKK